MHRYLFLFLIFILLYNQSNGFRVFDVKGVETILALVNEDIRIKCKSDMPMAYCGFIHPSGKRYSFSGSSLDAGQCQVKIRASITDSGEWRCHIGGKGMIGMEVMQKINVRIVNELASVQKNITTVHGKQVTVACATTNKMMPLRYCRFEPPNGKPFSINSDVTSAAPILNRYYFPSNKSLDRGDCAVTIRKVKYEDVGTWTCGAGFDDGKEHIDTVTIDVEGLYTMSTASATGITFGSLGVIAFLGVLAFIVWKKRRFLGSGDRDEESPEEEELRHLPTLRTPQRSRQPSPQRSRQASLERSRQPTPQRSRQASPQRSRQASPQRSRQESPERQDSPLIKRIPLVTVESPSASGSPMVS